MNKRFLLEPEVAGQLGSNTIINTKNGITIIEKLHYEFDGWLGDDILESTPCFICTDKLLKILEKSTLSGYEVDSCEVSKSTLFEDIYPKRELPAFYWIKITGSETDDFSLSKNGSLVVSEKSLSVLKQVKIANCDITEL